MTDYVRLGQAALNANKNGTTIDEELEKLREQDDLVAQGQAALDALKDEPSGAPTGTTVRTVVDGKDVVHMYGGEGNVGIKK